MKTVYLDVLFTINLAVNYMLLLATARISGALIKRKRLIGGAAVGALYAVCMFFPQLELLYSMVFKLLFALSVCALAFGLRDWRRLIRLTMIFYAASFAFAGCMMALYYMLGADNDMMHLRNGVMYANISMGVLVVSMAVIYLLLGIVMRFSARRTELGSEQVVDVEVHAFGRRKSLRALVDTGNALCDPMTNRPVLVAEFAHVRELFPEDMAAVIAQARGDAAETLARLSDISKARSFRLLTYRAVGTDTGMLLAFQPDRVEIGGRSGRHLVAVTSTRLSENMAYSAVIGAGSAGTAGIGV